MKSLLLIANPIANKFSPRGLEQAVEVFKAAGYRVLLRQTARAGHATELARQAVQEGVALVAVAGGDGTFNEALNGLAGSGIPMGILPMGTTNVLAWELGLPRSARASAQRIVAAQGRQAWAGALEFPGRRRRLFFLMAGIGFDGQAVCRLRRAGRKHYGGKAAYVGAALRSLLRWQPPELSVVVDGKRHQGISSLLCLKAAHYGGFMKASRRASLFSPFLQCLLIRDCTRADLLRYGLGLLLGRLERQRGIESLACTEVLVEGSAWVQTDGDCAGQSPLRVSVAQERITLLW